MLIRFHRTASGASPVEKYLADLNARERAAVLANLKDLQDSGLHASGILTRQVRGKLWEVKVLSRDGKHHRVKSRLRSNGCGKSWREADSGAARP